MKKASSKYGVCIITSYIFIVCTGCPILKVTPKYFFSEAFSEKMFLIKMFQIKVVWVKGGT